MVPFDTESPFTTSGIRIGTPAITTRGFNESDCMQVVEWIDDIITNHESEATLKNVKSEVNNFMERFPLYPELKMA